MIRWAALLVVAADAALLRFSGLPWMWACLARFSLAAALLGLLVKTGTPREHLGLSFKDAGRDARWIFWCALFFLQISLAAGLMGVLLSRLGVWEPHLDAGRDFRTWSQAGEFALSGLLLAPLVEEAIYRGLVVPALREAFPAWGVVLSSSLIFYALHLAYGRPWWMLHYLLAGAILSWSFLRTGKLWVPIVLHSLGNILMGLDDLLLLFAPDFVHRILYR